jgi:hypothetical protein
VISAPLVSNDFQAFVSADIQTLFLTVPLGCTAALVAGCYSHWRWNGWIRESPTALREIATKPIMTGLGFGARVTLVTPALTGLALWMGLPLLSCFTDLLYHGLAPGYVLTNGANALVPLVLGALPVTFIGGIVALPFIAAPALPFGCGAGVLFVTWYKNYVFKKPSNDPKQSLR